MLDAIVMKVQLTYASLPPLKPIWNGCHSDGVLERWVSLVQRLLHKLLNGVNLPLLCFLIRVSRIVLRSQHLIIVSFDFCCV